MAAATASASTAAAVPSSGGKPRRNLPGTSRSELFNWKFESKLEDYQGTFGTYEYLQQLIKNDPSAVEDIVKLPNGQDKDVWILEHLRRFLLELNLMVVCLDADCNSTSCPKMCATADWEFLCAAHAEPKKCSAIDYTVHTLTGFTALLNNPTHFPSRIKVPPKSVEIFGSVVRRLYRVFAHGYYHHRPAFDKFEAETHLTKRFIAFALKYDLMTKAQLKQPPIPL